MNDIHCSIYICRSWYKFEIVEQWIFPKKPKFLTCLECVDSKSYFNTYIEPRIFQHSRLQILWKMDGIIIYQRSEFRIWVNLLAVTYAKWRPPQNAALVYLESYLHRALKTNKKTCNKNAMKNGNLKIIFHIWAKSSTVWISL